MENQVILLCGKIASGKSYYAATLQASQQAVLLSSDALMLTMFENQEGEYHDLLVARAKRYLLGLAEEILRGGCDVILDWGFWTKQSRAEIRQYFAKKQVPTTLHYLDIPNEIWQQRIAKRNAAVQRGEVQAYYVDEGLLQKLLERFEPPDDDEVDMYVR